VRVNVNHKEQYSRSSPVYDEPYNGFFKDQGFKSEGLFGLCEIRDSHLKKSAINLEGTFDNTESFFLPLAPVIISERVIFYEHSKTPLHFGNTVYGGSFEDRNAVRCTPLYEIIEKEEAGQDTALLIKSMLESVQKAGCKTWHGYIVSLMADGSSQVAVVEEDFTSARKKVEEVTEYATKTAVDLYSRLDEQQMRVLARDLPRLGDKLNREFSKLMQTMMSGSLDAEVEGLPEAEQYQRGRKIIEAPVEKWLQGFEGALQNAGLIQCEEDFYNGVSAYCSSHGINLVKSEVGHDLRKSTLVKWFEEAMK